ncbi:hypothetical protein PUR50_28870, partial [Enterobacter hormaechei subsp. steigerwaltii]|nr:hypothetical protein [Enterobacter hormaechei subsp. steigerwaltii]
CGGGSGLQRSEQHSHVRRYRITMDVTAGAVVGSGAKEVMWSFVTLMVITAMYALNYNRLHKNPYPLDAPISKD